MDVVVALDYIVRQTPRHHYFKYSLTFLFYILILSAGTPWDSRKLDVCCNVAVLTQVLLEQRYMTSKSPNTHLFFSLDDFA
jgi:hypothetical protein